MANSEQRDIAKELKIFPFGSDNSRAIIDLSEINDTRVVT